MRQRLDVRDQLDRPVRVAVRGRSGWTDGAIATALAVSVAAPAMRIERVEIFMSIPPD